MTLLKGSSPLDVDLPGVLELGTGGQRPLLAGTVEFFHIDGVGLHVNLAVILVLWAVEGRAGGFLVL